MSLDTMKKNTKTLKNWESLEGVIARAIKKVRGSKENDLCKYIPMESGGYMHHFTLRKMKRKNPDQLGSLIEKFIITPDRPLVIAPKPRATRGSRRRNSSMSFTKVQLERLLNMARLSGDTEMVSLLRPRRSLASYKKELISSIRQGNVDQELWDGYVETVNSQQAVMAARAEAFPEGME